MANRRMELGLLSRVAQVFRHSHPSMAELETPQIGAWADVNRARIGDMLALLDRSLANHAFIADDAYSIADITALVAIDFMRPIKYPRPAELTNLARWYDAVSTRPSAKA